MFVDHDQPVGIAEGQRLEQHRVDDGEQGCGGADAERHDQDGDDGEARRAA